LLCFCIKINQCQKLFKKSEIIRDSLKRAQQINKELTENLVNANNLEFLKNDII